MQPVDIQSDSVGAIRSLIQRLSLGPQGHSVRVITFIAARAREGTSTIAHDYAVMLARETGQKVLLVDAGVLNPQRFQADGINPSVGIVDAALVGSPAGAAIHATRQGISLARWIGDDKNRITAGKVLHNDDVWKTLSALFTTVIIDAPSLQSSFDGVMLSARADATVLVVEAEKTPEQVVRNLRDTLTAGGAKITGVVMNKRRYYIPEKIYSRL